MNFIVELSSSNEYNAIYVCVNRLTKMTHFCLTTTEISSERTVKLYLQHIFKHHDLFTDIVSDKRFQFIFKFTTKLLELLDVKENKSITYHLQFNEQTK